MRFGQGSTRRADGGFTLVDVFSVVLLLSLLAFLAWPIWRKTMADARTRLCAGNFGQMGRAMALYANDHEEMLPGNQHSPPSWVQSLAKYSTTNAYHCPDEIVGERRLFTIALNDFLTPRPYGARQLNFSKRTLIPEAQETLMFAEADESYRAYDHFHFADARENGYSAEAFSDQVDVERHGAVGSGGANYLFADGRVEELMWRSAAKPKLMAPGSRFVNPVGEGKTGH